MPHVVFPRPHPNIAVMKITGDLTFDDMTAVHPLGLHEGKPLAVLLDVTEMSTGLPDGFLTGAQQSFFVHENLIHLALYTESSLLRNIGLMVAKITRRRDKLSVHATYEAALAHLKLIVEEFNQA